jgi:hypothetical protein
MVAPAVPVATENMAAMVVMPVRVGLVAMALQVSIIRASKTVELAVAAVTLAR